MSVFVVTVPQSGRTEYAEVAHGTMVPYGTKRVRLVNRNGEEAVVDVSRVPERLWMHVGTALAGAGHRAGLWAHSMSSTYTCFEGPTPSAWKRTEKMPDAPAAVAQEVARSRAAYVAAGCPTLVA